MDWVYGQAIGFLGNFFALMGNMGVELFELEWVSAIILFFSRLAWALFTVSVVVCVFECGIEYSTGRGNLQQCGMNIIKGFLAVSLFTVVPVRLYALSVSLQGTFSAGLTGYGRSIGEVGQDIITELSEIQTLSDVINSSHFGLGIITSPIMLLFCVILMGYAVIKVFFANLKRGGILLIQIAVGSLYMFSVPRGYLDGFMGWVRQVIGLCLTAFLQSTILVAGLMVFKDHALMGVGLMLSAGEVPRIAGSFGLDTTTKANSRNPCILCDIFCCYFRLFHIASSSTLTRPTSFLSILLICIGTTFDSLQISGSTHCQHLRSLNFIIGDCASIINRKNLAEVFGVYL